MSIILINRIKLNFIKTLTFYVYHATYMVYLYVYIFNENQIVYYNICNWSQLYAYLQRWLEYKSLNGPMKCNFDYDDAQVFPIGKF